MKTKILSLAILGLNMALCLSAAGPSEPDFHYTQKSSNCPSSGVLSLWDPNCFTIPVYAGRDICIACAFGAIMQFIDDPDNEAGISAWYTDCMMQNFYLPMLRSGPAAREIPARRERIQFNN
jgi:hypothetical protein